MKSFFFLMLLWVFFATVGISIVFATFAQQTSYRFNQLNREFEVCDP